MHLKEIKMMKQKFFLCVFSLIFHSDIEGNWVAKIGNGIKRGMNMKTSHEKKKKFWAKSKDQQTLVFLCVVVV